MPDEWEINPSLSRAVAQQGVADAAGGIAYGSGVQADSELAAVAFGGPTADFILYGVVNGAFAQGPVADPTGWIDPINNPLPYWTGPTQVSGGAIQCSWVADASSPSGYNLRFTINPGAAGDEAYVEQIVPIGGDRGGFAGAAVRYSAGSAGSFTLSLSIQALKADGTTTGSAFASSGYAGNGYLPVASFPTDALSLRIRIDVARGAAAASASGTIDIYTVKMDLAHPYLVIGDSLQSVGIIRQANGQMGLYPEAATDTLAYLTLDGPSASTAIGRAAGNGTVQIVGYLVSPLEFGHASDTTLSRSAAGVLAVESGAGGVAVSTVAFPATQSSSADVNTLDDYEEGTFTPALAYATVGTSSWAITTQLGFYTKIGNVVIFTLFYSGVPTNGTGAGNLTLTGLPFTAKATTNENHLNACSMTGWTKANYTAIGFQVQQGGTLGQFQGMGSAQAIATLTVADIPTGGTVQVRSSGIYMTAS